MDDLIFKTIPTVLIAIIGWCIAIWQYYSNHSENVLEKELERLRKSFAAIENGHIDYKSLTVGYPLSVTNEYRFSFFRVRRRKVFYNIDVSLSVYDNFYAYIHKAGCHLGGTELTLKQMQNLYDNFIGNIVQRDYVDHAFQVMYYSIQKVVSKKFLRRKTKVERISRIQNTITSKQAISYFFNQVHYADRQRKGNHFLAELYDWEFFKKMFESEEYKNIQNVIPLTVEKLFFKQEKGL